jgi:hypothetical protein
LTFAQLVFALHKLPLIKLQIGLSSLLTVRKVLLVHTGVDLIILAIDQLITSEPIRAIAGRTSPQLLLVQHHQIALAPVVPVQL